MYDLIQEYEWTLKVTRKAISKIENKILDLKVIYENPSMSELQRHIARDKAKPLIEEKSTLNGSVRDLIFCLQWLKTGRCPDNRRGIERRSVYQNTALMDPFIMQQYFSTHATQPIWESDQDVNSEQELIQQLLSVLTDTEREAYLLKKGYNFSLNKIAEDWGISKAAVSKTIKRAEIKIAKHIETLKEMGKWNLFSR